jgi:heme a synthase
VRLPRITAAQFRIITLVVVAAVAVIVITGAAVRLSDSGLGCPDWPNCTQHHFVAKASFHPQVEQINRDFTGLVSVAVAVAVLGSLALVPRRRDLIAWSLGLVGGLVAEIVLGGIVVISHLWPPFVAAHFLLGMALVWNAVVLHDRAGHADTPGSLSVAPALRPLVRVLVVAAGAVLITGTIVTGTGPNGGDQHVKRLPFLVEDVARIHSLTVWTFLALTVATLVLLVRTGASAQVRRRTLELMVLIVAQGVLGYTQYALGVPRGLVLLHVVGAVAVWIAALRFYLGLYAHPDLDRPPLEPGDVTVVAG